MQGAQMTFDQLDRYLLSLQGATYDYPFDEETRVYRIANKMFALTSETHPLKVNLKCDPIYALELRNIYKGISAGYHMSKKHWNTVVLEDSDVDEETIHELIDHSYELIYKSLTKKLREGLG
jgi:predicted DNA-binding protein (MmcQ/YjbR family)